MKKGLSKLPKKIRANKNMLTRCDQTILQEYNRLKERKNEVEQAGKHIKVDQDTKANKNTTFKVQN